MKRAFIQSLFAAFLTVVWLGGGLVGSASAATDFWSTAPGVGSPDTLDDVWQSLYNGWGLSPTGDEDKDGCSNFVESVAATDPRNSSDCIKVGNMVITAGNILFTFKAEAGKKYRVMSDASPGGSFTTVVSHLEPVNGATLYVPSADSAAQVIKIAKAGGTRMFYRLEVTDVDADGDGVSDWAERETGLNPTVAESTPGVPDGSYVNAQLAVPSQVNITADAPFASEDGPTAGSFTVTRTSKLLPMTVNFTAAGTATAGADYTSLPTTVVFAAGDDSKTLPVMPMQNVAVEGGESVVGTLAAPLGANFAVGSNPSATVIINDSTVATGTGLTARYYDTASTTSADAANFGQAGMYVFTRGSPTTSGSVVVTCSGGTPAGLAVGHLVKTSFSTGSLNTGTYNHLSWTVSAVTTNTFTATITGVTAFSFASTNGNCAFSVLSLTHPATATRVDSTVNFDWQHGTPNGSVIAPNNSPDQFSSAWEAFLHPTTAGDYTFQLDADDKARVLIDLNNDGDFLDVGEQVVEHGWDTLDGNSTAEVVGTFKPSAAITLAVPATPAQRLKMRVEHVETAGDARCRLQWKLGTGSYGNIPQANQFTHTQPLTYLYTGGNAIVSVPAGHSFSVGNTASLAFSSGGLFTPGAASSYNGNYSVAAVGGGAASFTVAGASTTSGSATVAVPSTAGLAIGMAVSGTGLPSNEYITAIGTGQITVTTGTGVTAQANTTLTFTSTLTVAISGFTIPITGATTIAGSPNILVPSTNGLAVGMAITGTGLPANEFITAILPSVNGPGIISVTTGTGVTAQASTTLTAALPATSSGNGFVLNQPTSTTTGAFNLIYPNTGFTGSAGRVGVDAAVTTGNNGLWYAGSPSSSLIQPETFTARWTGQVQPQFSEEYTFVVQADDGCALWINGQPQVLKMYASANTGGSTYAYNATTGDLTVTYSGLASVAGSFLSGETIRIDPSSSNLNHAPTNSPTYNYDPTTGIAVVDYTNLVTGSSGGTRTPGSYSVGEIVEIDPVSGGLTSLATLPYTITAVAGNTFSVNVGALSFTPTISISSIATGAACQITTAVSHNLTSGTQVRITGVSGGTFSSAINDLYTITVTGTNTFTVGSNCTVAPVGGTGTVSVSGNVTISDNRNVLITSTPTPTSFVVNIGAGKYVDASAGSINIEIVNKSLKDWSSNGNERFVRIPMIGGQRYDIQYDLYENTGAARAFLSWFSASQPKQIIPQERLYPTSVPQAPAIHTSPTYASALVGGAFSLAVAGSNGGSVTLSGKPSWLTFTGGVLSGTPPAGTSGSYQITVTTTNAVGSSVSVVNLAVQDTGGAITREVWSSVTGTTVADIPVATNPTLTGTRSTLESPLDNADNYGERIRGWITAPTTGNYYFWLAASDSAELWISNDEEPVNIFKRAAVTAGTASQEWNKVGETQQKSGWLALEEGKRYYVEVLHKGGVGSDNCAVGWSKPGESTTAPSEVVPGYVLSPYVEPVPATPGTLFVATMLAQGAAVTNGVGSSTLRLSEDESTAYMRYSKSGLSGAITSQHIHMDPNPGHGDGEIVYDIDTPATPGDGLITNVNDPNYGSYKWTLNSVGTYSASQILEAIKGGKAYINLHTALYPAGEIRGNYTLANGTRHFSPPAAPPSWTDDSDTDAGAVRFLTQATFGANIADITALKALTATGAVPAAGIPASRYNTWIDNQFGLAFSAHLPEVLAREIADAFGPFDTKISFDTWWKTSLMAPDQLRQRVAFALSEIHVVSAQGPLEDNSRAISDFYDTLGTNAFGNFRTLLEDTTLTPAMGRYLDMLRNDKPDLSVGRIPNENYAREIKQLFSIGLYRMWPDGTLMLTSRDSPIDTYSQREIVGLAHVFSGWEYGYDGAYRTSFSAAADWTRPMREVPARHFTGTKRVLNNEVIPGLATVGGQPLDGYATHTAAQINDPAYQALASKELDAVHEMLFNHPNTGPFICRQLIQRMVTSNPSRDYLYRVVQKFNNNGSGVRGDMQAVIKAILLDYEARSPAQAAIPAFGKQREPIMRVANAVRAFRPANVTGTYSQTGTNVITITTSTPHLLTSGSSVFLEFTDTTGDAAKPAPTTGTYTVLASPTPTSTTYAISAPGWISGTYSQTAGQTSITVSVSGHWLPAGGSAYIDFLTATSGTAVSDGVKTALTSTSVDFPSGVGNVSGSTFTIAAPDTTARAGTLMISRFSGSYSCSTPGAPITIDTVYGSTGTFGTMADHHLAVGNNVFLNFANSRDTTSGNETSTENDLVYPIITVPDSNTFTVLSRNAANAAMNSDNQAFIFPQLPQPVTRSGTINARPSTYTMDNTDTDLQQTPLNSPTVFNYFLPDYKYAGSLASQGITTPEFQLTSETTAIRQANFMFAGVYGSSSATTGFSSFKTGSNALVMDLSPWMTTNAANLGLGVPTNTTSAWTSNANAPVLIDQLNTLLMAGQLPATAKTQIQGFLFKTFTISGLASPVVITSTGHGLVNGDSITISGVTGGTFSTAINATFTVSNVTANTFTVPTNYTAVNSLNTSSAHFSTIPYTNSSPTSTMIRDRLRAIIHLIITSPDYTIQR